MKNILGLLIVVGLLAVAFVNREAISARFRPPPPVVEVIPEPPPAPPEPILPEVPPPTPHPATEGQKQARQLYPGIAIPNSPLNKKFISLYAEAKTNNPALLTDPDWPMQLAERAVIAMGGAPLPRTTPAPLTPKPLPGTVMDQQRPKGR